MAALGVEDRRLDRVPRAHRAIEEMRVVPFDRRSALELFSSAALPFAPLLFIAQLPEKLQAVIQLFS